jgi:hypothetical protein
MLLDRSTGKSVSLTADWDVSVEDLAWSTDSQSLVVTAEDRGILEATDADTPIDLSRRAEMHMASDRPGLIMRQRLMELFEKHGETEVCHPAPVAG